MEHIILNGEVKKWGNSLALRLSSKVCKKYDITEGTELELQVLHLKRNGQSTFLNDSITTLSDLMKQLPELLELNQSELNRRLLSIENIVKDIKQSFDYLAGQR